MAPTKKQKLIACLSKMGVKEYAQEIAAVSNSDTSSLNDDIEMTKFFFNLFTHHPQIENNPHVKYLENYIKTEVGYTSFEPKAKIGFKNK